MYLDEKSDAKLSQCRLFTTAQTATISWQWPAERNVRMAIIFCCPDEFDINQLVADCYQLNHQVIMRDLSSEYTHELEFDRCKFVVCPAFFDDSNNIALCPPSFVTDWVYKKTMITPKIVYSPLRFSQFQKAHISVTPAVDAAALTYSITEEERVISSYNFDQTLMPKGGFMYIGKNQRVKISVTDAYSHLYEVGEA